MKKKFSDLRQREFNPLKIWHHAERLQALASGKDIAPVTVEIDPVAYCNHHCFWCVDPSHKPVTASRDFLWRLLAELADFVVNGFGVQGIVFKGGGEPTLHPEFPALVEKTVELGFKVGIVTNGSRLLKAGIAEALAEHASYVRISVDGPTAETHQRVHGSQDFELVLAGVERIMALRSTRHPIVGLSFAMDYEMVSEIPLAIELGDNLGVDYVLVRPPFFEEVGRSSTMTPAQARELRWAMFNASKAYQGSMDVLVGNWIGDSERDVGKDSSLSASGRRAQQTRPGIPIEHRTGKCWASLLLAVITADGHVFGCCNLRFLDAWSFGQVNYEQGIGFRDVWEGSERQLILQRMHIASCITHCTHPMSRYNEIIEVLRDSKKPHSEFI